MQHREDGSDGAFYFEENGAPLAEMTYRRDKDRMIIEHTEVDESLRGKNIGFQLVESGVEYAREQHLKIVPVCQFAKTVIQRYKEMQDVCPDV